MQRIALPSTLPDIALLCPLLPLVLTSSMERCDIAEPDMPPLLTYSLTPSLSSLTLFLYYSPYHISFSPSPRPLSVSSSLSCLESGSGSLPTAGYGPESPGSDISAGDARELGDRSGIGYYSYS